MIDETDEAASVSQSANKSQKRRLQVLLAASRRVPSLATDVAQVPASPGASVGSEAGSPAPSVQDAGLDATARHVGLIDAVVPHAESANVNVPFQSLLALGDRTMKELNALAFELPALGLSRELLQKRRDAIRELRRFGKGKCSYPSCR